jgi:hypothetical protein
MRSLFLLLTLFCVNHIIIPVVDREYFPAAKKIIQEAEKSFQEF